MILKRPCKDPRPANRAGVRVSGGLRRVAGPRARRQKPPVIAAPGSEHATIKIRHLYARLGGLDTVVFGSGDLSQAHSDHEAVELDQVTRGIAILVGFLSVN